MHTIEPNTSSAVSKNKPEAGQPFFAPAIQPVQESGNMHSSTGLNSFFPPRPQTIIQTKLQVNTPGDSYEQQADAVADQVMRMRDGDAPIVQRMPLKPMNGVMRMCSECAANQEEDMGIHRKESSSGDAGGHTAPPIVSQVLASGGGQAMDSGTRQFMETRFGQDFSSVRIHTDSRAAESASAIQARAYTSGNNVVFGAGEYQPGSEGGRRLLAHELVHVGQQAGDNLMHGNVIQRVGAAAAKAAGRALGWLARRGKTVSKHVARHTRPLVRTGVHSIFKRANNVKDLVELTIKQSDNFISQVGSRGTRFVIEKEFNRVIGKNGETILKVVIETSGRIVTAYPVRAFTKGTAAGLAFYLGIDEASAAAQEKLDVVAANAQRITESQESSFWEDVALDIVTFGLYGGSLNEGEDASLYAQRETNRIIEEAVQEAIHYIEQTDQNSITQGEKDEIRQLIIEGIDAANSL